MSEVSVALAGIAGYGHEYLECLLNDRRAAGMRLVGVVDPYPQRCRHLEQLGHRGIPIYPTLQQLFAASSVELMMIATPIHLHAQQTCLALKHRANVLCEKPLAATLDDVRRIVECERAAAGQFVAIGYQWSFSDAIQALKGDIISGALGRAVRMKTIAVFPRSISYFGRNDWAGRLRTSEGDAVFDSPTNNATAHYLHNMLYLLGRTRETSAMPAWVQAELYRANEIENYDTTALRATLAGGTELLFYSTHAAPQRLGPRCEFEFEHAIVRYDFSAQPRFIARFHDGRVRDYGDPNGDRMEKIWRSIDVVRTGAPVACGVAAATPHALAVIAAQQSAPAITHFPQAMRRTSMLGEDAMLCVDGLDQSLIECFERGVLPAETARLAWARAAVAVKCADLTFDSRPRATVTVAAPGRGVYAS